MDRTELSEIKWKKCVVCLVISAFITFASSNSAFAKREGGGNPPGPAGGAGTGPRHGGNPPGAIGGPGAGHHGNPQGPAGGRGVEQHHVNPPGHAGGPGAGPRFDRPDPNRPHLGPGEGRGLHRGENPPGPRGGSGTGPGVNPPGPHGGPGAGAHPGAKEKMDLNHDGIVGPKEKAIARERWQQPHSQNSDLGSNPPGAIGGAGTDLGNPPGPQGGPGAGPRFYRPDPNHPHLGPGEGRGLHRGENPPGPRGGSGAGPGVNPPGPHGGPGAGAHPGGERRR